MAKGRKTAYSAFDAVFGGDSLQIPILTSGEVTKILGIEMPRLERFLDNYPLFSSKPGQGHGSRRLFSQDDVRRLFVAKWLLDDQFQPKCVIDAIKQLKGRNFIEYDKDGQELYPSLAMRRDLKSKVRNCELQWSRSGKLPVTEGVYYCLDLYPLITEVDQRIKAALEKRGKT